MKNIEVRLGHVEELVRRVNQRLRNIIDTREHYLRTKARKNTKTYRRLHSLMHKLERLEKALGPTSLVKEQADGERIMLLFTKYERVKLRKMPSSDYKGVFKCTAAEGEQLQQLLAERSAPRVGN